MKKREGVFLINKKKPVNNNGGIVKSIQPHMTPEFADSSYRPPKGYAGFKPRPATSEIKSAAEAAEETKYKHPGAAKIYTP